MKKYEFVANDLEKKLCGGRYLPNQKLPTEDELILQYGVSRITVRAALEILKTKGLIRRFAGRGTIFVGNSPAADAKKPSVALIIQHSVKELIKIVEGVEEVLEQQGFSVLLHISNGNSSYEQELCRKSIASGAAGIILVPNNETDNKDYFSALVKQNLPVVFIDRTPLPFCNYVSSNNFLGMYRMTQYILQQGHKNIAYATTLDYRGLRERLQGFSAALKDYGLPFSKNNLLLLPTSFNYIFPLSPYSTFSEDAEKVQTCFSVLFQRKTIPTAVLCCNDFVALTAIRAAAKAGRKVPQDLSVTGYDNADFTHKNICPLTTMDQNFYTLGKTAATMIVQKLQSKTATIDCSYTMPELILRGSTQPLRSL